MRGLASCSLWSGTKDDGIECLVGTCNMYLIDIGMIAKISAFSGPTGNYVQIARLDQGVHPLLDQGSQIGIDRIGFVEDDLILLEELVENVERADAGHIARSEHQRDFRAMMGVMIDLRLSLFHLL